MLCHFQYNDLINSNAGNQVHSPFKIESDKATWLSAFVFMAKYKNSIRSAYYRMIDRCYNPKNISYPNYGGRGVRVCQEWLNNYQSFLSWSLLNGWDESLQLDKDIKGSGMIYSPQTCLWVTRKENAKHKRNAVNFIVDGKKINLQDISKKIGIDRRTISRRLQRGWSKEKSISEKLHPNESTLKNFGAFKNGELIYRFENVQQAIDILGGDKKRYWRFLNGITKYTKIGFEFKFLKNEENN